MRGATNGPVFVDDSGRRQHLFRRGGHVAIGCFCCYLALVAAGLTGYGPLAGIRLPILPQAGHAHAQASAKTDALLNTSSPPAPVKPIDLVVARPSAPSATVSTSTPTTIVVHEPAAGVIPTRNDPVSPPTTTVATTPVTNPAGRTPSGLNRQDPPAHGKSGSPPEHADKTH